MAKCVFARACVCTAKTKTRLTRPHDRLFITQGTAQFLSYYEPTVDGFALRLERCIMPRFSRNSEQT